MDGLQEKAAHLDEAMIKFDDELFELMSASAPGPTVESINNWARLTKLHKANSEIKQKFLELQEVIESTSGG